VNEIVRQDNIKEFGDFERRLADLRSQIAASTDCAKVLNLMAAADSIEEAMANAGYRGNIVALRPANELRFEARWKIGQLLAKIEKRQGARTDLTSSRSGNKLFEAYLKEIGLNKNRANECQRIGAIPESKLKKAFEEKEKEGVLNTIQSMFSFARPFWKVKVRSIRHRAIMDAAVEASSPDKFGPFPLIYADPPTHFEVYSSEGSHRSSDQHYPTLSWKEIENFTIYGKRVEEVAHENAMLFLWTTSSNIPFALDVMRAWGFDFKTSAAWDKGVLGTGLIFRNQHELLFYGSRGDVPGPIYLPPSLFRFPRGKHSAKPSEIRAEIERMYPAYGAAARLELFSRDSVPGWTHFGFEANAREAAE
jgi:N6-adenosine-specific RNA methylase IME4